MNEKQATRTVKIDQDQDRLAVKKFWHLIYNIHNVYNLSTATSIYTLHFLSTSRVLLYRDTIDRVLFYIEMTVMMSDYPHKVLKLVCQAMVEIFANFVA